MESNEIKKVGKSPLSKTSKSTRKYDILDLMIIGIYNALVFMSGMAVGWLVWKFQW